MKYWMLLLLGCICITGCKSQTSKINGVSFVASGDSISYKHVNHVQKVSANYITLMPFAFIKDLSSPKVEFNFKRQWFGETDAGIKQYAKEFTKQQIKVMVKPQIWVWHGEFTGNIKMKTEEEWKLLEDTYSKFILSFAKTAEEINADILCIGTELEQFVIHRPDYWKQLIKEIKKVYKGKLTYAANWDEYKRVPFWDMLDFIGIDAYFPLSTKKQPTLAEFEAGWQKHKAEIKVVRQKVNKPVLFTEYGYRSVNYTGKQPWDANKVQGQVNLDNQANALQALYNQFWKEDWFAGGFIWKWFIDYENVGGVNNNRFTPQNKPAETTIKKTYETYN